MEPFGCYRTKRRRIKARVEEHMRFWRDLHSNQNSMSSNQNLDSFETDSHFYLNRPSSRVTHQSSEDESDSCGGDDLPPNPPHGLRPSVHQRARHPSVPSSASQKERHHRRLQSPVSVRESPSMRHSSESQSPSSASESRVRRSSGSQSPSSASESRVRRSSGSQGPTCPNCVGPTVYRNLMEFIEKQAEEMRVVKSMLNTVLKQQALPLAVSLLEPPAGSDFPLKTYEDVVSMNEKLSDPAFMSGVVAMVTDIGGTSLDDATRRMMQYLISHDLAVQFNLYGRHNKRKFRELRLYDVIYGGLKKNALTQETNHKDAEKALSKWFSGARDRGGRRVRPQTQLPQLDDAPLQ